MPEIPPHGLHEVELRHRIGSLAIDVRFTLTRPWTILFGPSGSGKTTILRSIAGLERGEFARVVSRSAGGSSAHASGADDSATVLADTAAGVWVSPHRRLVRLAPQQASLFPHRTVLENVTYGATAESDASPAARAAEAMRLFRLEALATKRPAQLSGGEAQRVNLARAFAATPCRLLLLDEPLTGLDQALRGAVLTALMERSARTQILSVTHDVAEAFQLGAEIIKLHEGRIVAQGPAAEVLAAERMELLRHLGAEQLPLHSAEPYLGG